MDFHDLPPRLAQQGHALERGDRIKIYDLTCLPMNTTTLVRFMMKLLAGSPDEEQEVEVLRTHQQGVRVEDLDRFGLAVVGGTVPVFADAAAAGWSATICSARRRCGSVCVASS